jgi:hypothetical protein
MSHNMLICKLCASKNRFHNKNDFSQGIDSVESMPGVLKSQKILTLSLAVSTLKSFAVPEKIKF